MKHNDWADEKAWNLLRGHPARDYVAVALREERARCATEVGTAYGLVAQERTRAEKAEHALAKLAADHAEAIVRAEAAEANAVYRANVAIERDVQSVALKAALREERARAEEAEAEAADSAHHISELKDEADELLAHLRERDALIALWRTELAKCHSCYREACAVCRLLDNDAGRIAVERVRLLEAVAEFADELLPHNDAGECSHEVCIRKRELAAHDAKHKR